MDDLSHGSESEFPAPRLSGHPLPETLAEAEILAARIERAVWQETGGRVRDLHVEVSRRGVTLRGCCNTYYTKQQAQHAAMAVPGGGQLSNQIEVA
jgi:osmotically-inducible protein OsmY